MNFTIVHQDQLTIVGIEQRITPYSNNESAHIDDFWKEFINDDFPHIPDKLFPTEVIGMYTNYQAGSYSVILGAQTRALQNLPIGFKCHTIKSAQYACFTITQGIDELIEAWKFVWSSAFTYKRSFTCDYEIYKNINDLSNIMLYIAIEQ